jgi:transposase
MSRRIRVEGHLSTEELQQRYRSATHPAEKMHWQVLWLVAKGDSAEEVAEVTTYTADWVRMLVRRYNRGGPEAVLDGRRGHSGRRPLLSPAQKAELPAVLEGPAPCGGLWSGPEVARWMSGKLGKPVLPQRGWEYLRRAGQTLQIPRPSHKEGDPDAQEAFQEGTPRARSPGAQGTF